LKEADRLLKSKSWLVLYENYFFSQMAGNIKFSDWYPNVYVVKFPVPPRNDNYNWSNKNLNPKNLNFVTEETFKNPVKLNKAQLVSYFTTQSNIIASVETGKTTYKEAESWLNNELAYFFADDKTEQTFYFGNWIKYIQRAT
jgi:hypothetical protein